MANSALIDELERQFRDNPRRVFARLANEYRKNGEMERALEICYAHVPQQPGYISGHIVLGQTLFDAGELETARQTFETALTLDPENLIALRQLGDIARHSNDLAAARGWYSRLLDVDPQNEDVVAQLGELALAGDSGAPAQASPVPAESESRERIDESSAVALEEEPESEGNTFGSVPTSDPASQTDSDPHSNEVSAPVQGLQGNGPDGEEDLLEFEELEPLDAQDASSDQAINSVGDVDEDEAEASELTWLDSGPEAEPAPAASSSFVPDGDLDFGFISEEHDDPLDLTITGEHLSVVAEEDPLAGVKPRLPGNASPFGSAPLPRIPDESDDFGFGEELEQIPAPSGEPRESSEPDPGSRALVNTAFELGEAETLIHTTGDFGLSNWGDSDESRVDDSAPEGLLTSDGTETMPAATAEGLVPTEEVPMYEDPSVLEDDSAIQQTPDAALGSAESDRVEETSPEDFRFAPVEEDFPDDQSSVTAEFRSPDEEGEEELGPAAASDTQSPAFVTETMAELYLRQGYEARALDVYRQLAVQQPDDEHIRAKIAELQGPVAGESGTHHAAESSKSAARFFSELAARQLPASTAEPPEPLETTAAAEEPSSPEAFGGWADSVLNEAGEVGKEDDAAATALSSGYAESAPQTRATTTGTPAHTAAQELSLDEIFGSSERNRESSRGASASLDAFFTPEGERADNGDSSADLGPDSDDLEAFSAWLEGLKK